MSNINYFEVSETMAERGRCGGTLLVAFLEPIAIGCISEISICGYRADPTD